MKPLLAAAIWISRFNGTAPLSRLDPVAVQSECPAGDALIDLEGR